MPPPTPSKPAINPATAAAIAKTGLSSDQVNVNAEWDLYQSDKEGYRNHLKLKN